MKYIPVNRPLIRGGELNFVSDCIKSGWISAGSYVKKFEKKFAKLVSRKYAVSVSSGTAALDIAIKSINIKKGDHIIYLKISLNYQLKRTMYDKTRPLINLEDKKTTLKNLQKIRTSFYKEISTMEINQDGRSSSHIIKEIISNIHEGRHGLSEN